MVKVKVPDYTASPRQEVFHKAVADEVLYGGAAGGGKSAAIVAEGITIALEYPGIPVDFFRRSIPELKATIMVEVYKQAGEYIKQGHMKWHGQDRYFELSNGSRLRLNYLDNDADVFRYQGAEMPVLCIDELTQFQPAWIEYLKTRNRTSNPDWPVIFRAGTNPGGVGHGFVKSYFVDIAPPETTYTDPLTGLTRIFIPAKVDDHPLEAFKQSYGRKLDGIADPNLRRALRDGDWDVFAGQVFTEWARHKHVVEPFAIPDHWMKWRAMDYGNKNSVFWLAQDPQTERTYVYREYREDEYKTVAYKSKMILDLEQGEDIRYGMADPALWNGSADHDDKEGDPLAVMFEKHGVKWQPANNDRKAGLAVVHDMLSTADDGKPKLQVFSTCLSLIKTLPALPYDRFKVDDVDTHADDHDYDSLRYGLMKFRPKKGAKPTIKRQAWVQRAQRK
jgi:hypothetical protein